MTPSTPAAAAYPVGKKISCLIAPLAHTGLKRIPVQYYLGKVLHELSEGATPARYVFGTPHGLLLAATHTQLEEPTAEQYRELEELEADATDTKILYGGDTGLREFITTQKKSK